MESNINIFDINNNNENPTELQEQNTKLIETFINTLDKNSNHLFTQINDFGIIHKNFMIITKNNVIINGILDEHTKVSNATNVNLISSNFTFKGDLFNYNLKQGILKHNNYEYNGSFKNGSFEGNGIINYTSNDYYNGEFKNGLYHGRGYSKINNIYYYGTFHNDKYNNKGILVENNLLYKGFFTNGHKHGCGYEIIINDSLIIFENDIIKYLDYIDENFDNIINSIENESFTTIYDNGTLISKKTKLEQDFENALLKITELEVECDGIRIENKNFSDQINYIKNNTPTLQCKICFTNTVNVILQPCNHIIICKTCCEQTFIPYPRYNNHISMNSTTHNNTNSNTVNLNNNIANKCPVCRTRISKYVDIFIN